MKHVRKIFAFVVALVMAFAVAAPAIAQTASPQNNDDKGSGSITITNAAKGEEYKIYRLFDATVSADGKISYTGTVPSELSTYFADDGHGNINATNDAIKEGSNPNTPELTDAARNALRTWANAAGRTPTASATSDGSQLTFDNLKFGYYVVTTTQADGLLISVDSTKPSVQINDKNTTTPIPGNGDNFKTVNNTNVKITDTVTFTIKFNTANYNNVTDLITSYTITDNFANGALTNISAPTVKVDGTEITGSALTVNNWQGRTTGNGTITIPWAKNNNTEPVYDNGAEIEVTYTATVSQAAVAGAEGNTNSATISFTDKNNQGGSVTDTATFKTYAFALKKVNTAGQPLSGAKFTLPFKADQGADGVYVYAGEGSTEVTTPESGYIIVKGLKSGDPLSITEVEAPSGYNKLNGPVSVTPSEATEITTTTTKIYDKNGNVVETATNETTTVEFNLGNIVATPVAVINKTGAEMPSTGGIGTTIFYVVGGVMVAGAVVFLLTKRRAAAE